MCGIVGLLGRHDPATVRRMAQRIAHRGPDDDGFFEDRDAGVTLGHRRLSIIDLTSRGHQPMESGSGRFVIAYNGEIYNYPELRRALEGQGVRFRGHSDTEVLLELFEREGTRCLARLNGIFAFGIWDRRDRQLTVVRDGLGIKPLYLTRTPSGLAVASELKALLELPDLDKTLDPAAAVAYLTYLWSPGSRTMFRSVEKLGPGEWRTFLASGGEERGSFYSLPRYAPVDGMADADLIAGTAQGLERAVARQMLSDVQVGAFLSGGLDSSAIVAYARKHAPDGRLNCFTINYEGSSEERGELVADLPYARRVAAHLDVDLHEVRVDSSMVQDFDQLVYQLDEPQADLAALNSLYIAKLAREHGIKVLLSGTGGDDLFTGYRRHSAARHDHFWDFTPNAVRTSLAWMSGHLPTRNTATRRLRKLLDSSVGSSEQRLARMFEWLPVEQSLNLMSRSAATADEVREPLMHCLARTQGQPAVERLLRLDQRFFLIDHNLNYTDKTGMTHGVEIRVPFLDPELIQWAASLPATAKLRGGQTKWVLRKAMEPILPHDIIYRPKTGFGVPLRAWLKGPMRPTVEELLESRAVEDRGLFDPVAVSGLKRDTLAGRRDGSYTLLALVAIELWCRRFADPGGPAVEQPSIGASAAPVAARAI